MIIKMEQFKICNFPQHHKSNSLHHKNNVPITEFIRTFPNGNFVVHDYCSSCRYYKKMNKGQGEANRIKHIKMNEFVLNNPELYVDVRICPGSSHLKNSNHPKDKVPSKLFEKDLDDNTFYKTCIDCRKANNEEEKIRKQKKLNTSIDGMFCCKSCYKCKSDKDVI